MRLLAPSLVVEGGVANDSSTTATSEQPLPPRPDDPAKPSERTHTVKSGESAWSIGKRHGIPAARLLRMNGLKPGAVLRPGMVLQLDGAPSEDP